MLIMLTLTNARCRATFSPHGAELTSFTLDALDYLWPAEPAVWGRHAPVLFPIVGRLPDDTFLHRGRSFHLPQHGFARDREFALIGQSAEALTFELRDDAQSHEVFPFAFALRIRYELRGTTLTVGWEVHNPDLGQELLFSIGAHPAFRCPLLPEEQFEDYYFAFDHPVTLPRQLLRGGLRTGETAPVLTQQAELPLRYELFADDALVFSNYDFTALTLRSRRSARFVRVRFDGFPYLGLWTKGPGANFVCIEPWQGVASPAGPPQELADKEGILTLAPGQRFTAAYHVELG
ncbi:aldose 1-epimerase family protein [uncultured Hymenobacter sp.]|uniref:aldose 1-epimerase family protein n=1 Tax=uncultured Hymenobacter sp. TaxID=170016 RepID=UPI0035CA55B0